jgi:hypothetical protein
MAQIRITLNLEGIDDFRTEQGVEDLRARLYKRLEELMGEKSLAYEMLYNGERLPEFRFATIEEAAKTVEKVRFSLLFGTEPELGDDLGPIAEQHFLLALNSLDSASRYLTLAGGDFDVAVEQIHSDDV